MARKLYVGNLPYETGEQDLQELFASVGTVETVNVIRDMATGRARGFAFVEMATDEDAQKAVSTLNDYQYGGRNLTVNEARHGRHATAVDDRNSRSGRGRPGTSRYDLAGSDVDRSLFDDSTVADDDSDIVDDQILGRDILDGTQGQKESEQTKDKHPLHFESSMFA